MRALTHKAVWVSGYSNPLLKYMLTSQVKVERNRKLKTIAKIGNGFSGGEVMPATLFR
jgi:hypothetical protein